MPKTFIFTMNAGYVKEHWTQNPEIGGGRIIMRLVIILI